MQIHILGNASGHARALLLYSHSLRLYNSTQDFHVLRLHIINKKAPIILSFFSMYSLKNMPNIIQLCLNPE